MRLDTLVLLCCVTATCILGWLVWDLIGKVDYLLKKIEPEPVDNKDSDPYLIPKRR